MSDSLSENVGLTGAECNMEEFSDENLCDLDSDDGIDSATTLCQCGEETCGACQVRKGVDPLSFPKRYQNWQEILSFCERELKESFTLEYEDNQQGTSQERIPRSPPSRSDEDIIAAYEWRYLPYKCIINELLTDSTRDGRDKRMQKLVETALPRFCRIVGHAPSGNNIADASSFGKYLSTANIQMKDGRACVQKFVKVTSDELLNGTKKMAVYSCYILKVRLRCVAVKKAGRSRRNESAVICVEIPPGKVHADAGTKTPSPPEGKSGKKKRKWRIETLQDGKIDYQRKEAFRTVGVLVVHPTTNTFFCVDAYDRNGCLLPLPMQWLRIKAKDFCPANGGFITSIESVYRFEVRLSKFDILPPMGSTINKIKGFQLDDDDTSGPLFPPTSFGPFKNEEACTPTIEGTDEPDFIVCRSKYHQRFWVSNTIKAGCRRYVNEALYPVVPHHKIYVIYPLTSGAIDLGVVALCANYGSEKKNKFWSVQQSLFVMLVTTRIFWIG